MVPRHGGHPARHEAHQRQGGGRRQQGEPAPRPLRGCGALPRKGFELGQHHEDRGAGHETRHHGVGDELDQPAAAGEADQHLEEPGEDHDDGQAREQGRCRESGRGELGRGPAEQHQGGARRRADQAPSAPGKARGETEGRRGNEPGERSGGGLDTGRAHERHSKGHRLGQHHGRSGDAGPDVVAAKAVRRTRGRPVAGLAPVLRLARDRLLVHTRFPRLRRAAPCDGCRRVARRDAADLRVQW